MPPELFLQHFRQAFVSVTLERNTIISMTIVAVSATLMVLANFQNAHALAVVCKMTASSAFIAVAICSGALRNRYGRTILIALVFSWLGDLLLAGESRTFFLYGLASFLFAHCVYIVAFATHGIRWRRALAALLPVALISSGVSIWLGDFVPADMTIPVHLYTVVISTMVIAAFSTQAAARMPILPVGALLFYFSDLSVATAQFVHSEFPHYVWGLPFYFAGQTLLAVSVGKLSEREAVSPHLQTSKK